MIIHTLTHRRDIQSQIQKINLSHCLASSASSTNISPYKCRASSSSSSWGPCSTVSALHFEYHHHLTGSRVLSSHDVCYVCMYVYQECLVSQLHFRLLVLAVWLTDRPTDRLRSRRRRRVSGRPWSGRCWNGGCCRHLRRQRGRI